MGRKEKEIDWELVERMLHAGSDGAEIAGSLGIYPDTLYRQIKKKYSKDFTAFAAGKHSTGLGKIRLAQYEKAVGTSKKGDTSLLLHLGKVRLKQVEYRDDKDSSLPPNEAFLDLQNNYIRLMHEFNTLKNEIQSKAATELHRGGSSV